MFYILGEHQSMMMSCCYISWQHFFIVIPANTLSIHLMRCYYLQRDVVHNFNGHMCYCVIVVSGRYNVDVMMAFGDVVTART